MFHKRAFWKAPCRPIWRLFNQAHHQRWSDINQLIVSEHNGLIWTPTSPVMSRWVVTSDHRLSAPCQWSSLPTPSYLLIDSDHSQPHQWWSPGEGKSVWVSEEEKEEKEEKDGLWTKWHLWLWGHNMEPCRPKWDWVLVKMSNTVTQFWGLDRLILN